MRASFILRDRSDQELLTGIQEAMRREHEDVAFVIAHLAEMDRRELFAAEGCSSLFKYCIEVLHLSESQTYLRIDVARVARRFPIVLDMLADGLVHLTAVHRLAPSLTEENHRELLNESVHKSKEQVEEIVARLRPKPPVPSTIRKLPDPGLRTGADPVEAGIGLFENHGDSVDSAESPRQGPASNVDVEPARPAPCRKPVVSPLAPELYKIQFTADAETCRMLRQLQELMRHQIPSGDPALIVKRGLEMLLDHLKQQKFAQVKRPRRTSPEEPARVRRASQPNGDSARAPQANPEPVASVSSKPVRRPASRHIPAEVRNAVWERDEGRCAFVARNGRRCSERNWIQFHHVEPFAWGGEPTIRNIELRCRTHNAHEGEAIFGKVVRSEGAKARKRERELVLEPVR